MMNTIKISFGRSCFLAITAGSTLSASAALTALDSLVNGDFEATDIAGEVANKPTSWEGSSKSATGETDDLGTWANTSGAASQVGMIYDTNDTQTYLWQALTGTSDSNGANHALTSIEAVGDTITISGVLGIEEFTTGWQSAHTISTIGFQNQGSWEWVGAQTVYTGTLAQATTDGVTADHYLGLDDTNAGGDSVAWSHDYTIADIGTTTNNLVFAINTDRTSAGNGRLIFDDLAVTVVPEPSSTALLGLGGLALLMRRRK